MKPFHVLSVICLGLVTAACGGSSAGSDPAASASSSAPAPSSSGSTKVVPHEKLVALYPEIPGFKHETEPKGETDTNENVSRVTADYIQDGGIAGLSLEMMDVSTNQVMLAAFKEIQRHPGTQKTAAGTQKTTTIAGYPAYEEWTPEAKNGVVSVLVADRFVVTMTGNSVGDVSVIYKAMDAVDLKKIAALK